MNKSYLSWSSGKDAAYALHLLHAQNQLPDLILTTLSKAQQRVSMHGLRKVLLQQQQEQLSIPSMLLEFEANASIEAYETAMESLHTNLKNQGYQQAIFGDIFLEDLRKYREQQLQKMDFTAQFPLWGEDTHLLARKIIDAGIKAITVCINADMLPQNLLGHPYNHDFLDQLPSGVDPCGENGEFHTFCYDASYFKKPVGFEKGAVIDKSFPHPTQKTAQITFSYLDLLLAT